MSTRKRPAKRSLVRWSDDLDKGVLLAVQYASTEAGIKLPWGRVAEIMGPKFTEGAIIQHLAKLRTSMAAEGIPVPPALKRGMVTKTPSKVYANTPSKAKYEPVVPMYTGSPDAAGQELSLYDRPKKGRSQEEEGQSPKGKSRARAKSSRRNLSDGDEDAEPLPELYDSDGDFETPKKRQRKSKAAIGFNAAQAAAGLQDYLSTPTKQTIKAEEVDESNLGTVADESGGPATRTRGIKRDYSVMDANFSEEEAEHESNAADAPAVPDVDANENVSSEVSEISNPIVETADNAVADSVNLAHGINFAPQLPMVANLPYGQIHMVEGLSGDLNFTNTEPSMFPSAQNVFSANFVGGHHSFPPYSGNFGMRGPYTGSQFAIGGLPLMNPTPQASYYGTPAMVTATAGPSYRSTRNDSVVTGMSVPSLASQPDNDAAALSGAGSDSATDLPQTQLADVLGDLDMTASMPSEDIVWNDNLGEGYLEDDF